eukprot:6087968-Amphidinium_carterae.1
MKMINLITNASKKSEEAKIRRGLEIRNQVNCQTTESDEEMSPNSKRPRLTVDVLQSKGGLQQSQNPCLRGRHIHHDKMRPPSQDDERSSNST